MPPRRPRQRPPSNVGGPGNLGQVMAAAAGQGQMMAQPGVAAPLTAGQRRVGVNVYSATVGRDMLVNSPDGWEIEQPWLWYDPPSEGSVLGNPPPGSGAGRPNLPVAMARATSIIADGLAGMPWQVFQGQTRLDTPDWLADPQAKRVDQRIIQGAVPEWRKSAVEFRSALIRSMLWFGEAMIYVPVRNADGSPCPPVWQLHPWDVTLEDGFWQIPPLPGEDQWQSRGYVFEPGELIVIRNISTSGPRGVGVLEAHWRDLGLAMDMRELSRTMFRSGVPNGYLKVNAPNLTRDKAHEVQRDWMRAHGGPDKKIAVLNATTDFTPLTMDPASLQLAQARNVSNLDIALMFGVPPYMLGIAVASDTYANVASRLVELVEFTLLPIARRIESVIDAEFPRGTNMRINVDALRRADTTTRYQAYNVAIQGGWMDPEEVRALENLPPRATAAPLPAPVPAATGGSGPGAHAEVSPPAGLFPAQLTVVPPQQADTGEEMSQ